MSDAKPSPKKSSSLSFYYKPKVSFQTQEDNEKVILLLRRHPATNLSWIMAVIFLLIASFFFDYFPFFKDLPLRFQIATHVLWYLLALVVAIQGLLTWFFNVDIITNERIVDVNFYTLIYREISDAQIDRIQEVTHTIGGFMGTIFNFGDILIQTAGAVPNFIFGKVPNPAGVVKILQELQEGEENDK